MKAIVIDGDVDQNYGPVCGCLAGWGDENDRWAIELIAKQGYLRFESSNSASADAVTMAANILQGSNGLQNPNRCIEIQNGVVVVSDSKTSTTALGKYMPNLKRNFDQPTKDKLNCYVYALRDPRDGKVFYVGEGQYDRVFSHFGEADKAQSNNTPNPSAKVRRILEIWAQDIDVEWLIVRHGMSDQSQAFEIEAAVIDALDASMNGPALNEIRGQKIERGILYAADIDALAASPVNPEAAMTVFVFPIQNALHRLGGTAMTHAQIYQATRGIWRVTKQYRAIVFPCAVGLVGGISVGVFQVSTWTEDKSTPGKYFFDETSDPVCADLKNKSWLNVISPAKGYYQRGNHLVVEFDGKGNFRIIRGCPGHEWTPCE